MDRLALKCYVGVPLPKIQDIDIQNKKASILSNSDTDSTIPKFCSLCGAEIAFGSLFCANCGTSIE